MNITSIQNDLANLELACRQDKTKSLEQLQQHIAELADLVWQLTRVVETQPDNDDE